MIMLTAIDFHDHPGLVAYEVANVAADRHLASELVSLHLLRAQCLPDPPLRIGHVPT